MRWFKMTARVREKDAFLLWLSEHESRGVWEVDESTLVAYGLSPFPPPPPEYVTEWYQEEEEGEDWERRFRESFTTVRIGGDITVRPPWEAPSGAPFDIVIYPAFAFGTGHHPTTVLCLRMIRKYFREGMAFLDVGTGSGVLAFLALKMRASSVAALDCDPLAIAEFQRNAGLNGIPLEVVDLRLGSIDAISGTFDCIAANVSLHFHLEHLGDLVARLREGGYLILSGFERDDFPLLAERAKHFPLGLVEVVEDTPWVAVVYALCYDRAKRGE